MDADPAGNKIIFDLCILLFFTLMNAFFAGAEMAVVSVNHNRIRSLAAEGNKKAVVIQGLFERFHEVSFNDSGSNYICRILFQCFSGVEHFTGIECMDGTKRNSI